MLLAFALILSAVPCALAAGGGKQDLAQGNAEEGAKIALSASYHAGETTLQVTLQGAKDVTNGRFLVTYDPKLVQLEEAAVADGGWVSSVNREEAGEVSFAWVASRLTAEQTLMLTLRFTAVPGAQEDVRYAVQNTELYADGNKVALQVAQDELTIVYNPFTDIEKHWAKEEILRAYHAGLFKGTTPTKFAPNESVTRGMFVAVVYRLAGEPAVEKGAEFTDVPSQSYYAPAVAWAFEQGVTNGTSQTTFSPNKRITRQEMATMLYRYAKAAGEDVSDQADLSDFKDAGKISGWALEAMRWAVAQEILVGYKDGSLLPRYQATRAQAATIFCRYAGLFA